jgi:hypothetical protein
LFAMDRKWWSKYIDDVLAKFHGERWSAVRVQGVNQMPKSLFHFGNSGAAAIALASHRGAERVVLLGYDCRRGANGEVHHHGNHPKPLGNAGSMHDWPKQFGLLAGKLNGTEVINCSPGTALKVFQRASLAEVLDS